MGAMTQLYARVFVQILDSSIAEDYRVRYVFEDMFKLCDHKSGVIDMTREAMCRRLNIPREMLDHAISILEAPDRSSRDQDYEGRRIERLDDHRDWGWQILNWEKYENIRTRADAVSRVQRYRERHQESSEITDMAAKVYDLYPRKVGKPTAIRSIIRASQKVSFQLLFERTAAYAKAIVGTEQQFIPHPATWFNQERYNDDPSTWNKSGGNGSKPHKAPPIVMTTEQLKLAREADR